MLEKIKALYPSARIVASATKSPDCFSLSIQGQILAIPLSALDSQQQALLELLAVGDEVMPEKPVLTSQQQAWYAFLFNQQPLPFPCREVIRCVYLSVQSDEAMDDNLWQQTLADSMDEIKVVLPIAPSFWLVILSEAAKFAELVAVLRALDEDFGCSTQGCLGLGAKIKGDYMNRFQEEYEVAKQIMAQLKSHELLTLPAGLLRLMGQSVLGQYAMLKKSAQVLRSESDYAMTVRVLFEYQGNLSKAAEALYIHRNTLTYRINKYAKETGLNLQQLPDLIISYLLLEYKG